jgi:hypothetical protein
MTKELKFEKIESQNKPFVDWDKTKEVEGIVLNIREIKSDFGTQEICDVGDFSVNITAALRALPRYEGEYLKIVYLGMQESKKGRQFKAFDIFRRK